MNNELKPWAVGMVLGGVLIGAVGCAVAAPTDADRAAVVEGGNAFGLDLYARLSGEEGNLFLSPYSLSAALNMTYAGARGQTAAQMKEALHIKLAEDRLHPAFGAVNNDIRSAGKGGDCRLSVANALWAQKGYPFLKSYLAITKTHYDAGLTGLDFKTAPGDACKTINAWVEKRTDGKIKDLIQPRLIDELTRLVLTNAIYFKGKWATPFKTRYTKQQPFRLPGGKRVDVPMMHQAIKVAYLQTDNLQAVDLPYAGDRLSMTILLPKEVDGLPALEKALTTQKLASWIAGLQEQTIVVELPRFKMRKAFRLDESLKSMGMRDAFSRKDADFSGIDGKRWLFISAVVHQACVEVNEEGTEAAAGSAVIMKRRGRPTLFRADHPFLFLIRDRTTGSILFIGRVWEPKL